MKMKDIIARQDEPLRSRMEQLFRRFPPDAEVMLRQYKSGARLFREGDPNALVFVILSGSVAVSWDQPGQCQYLSLNDKPLTFVGDLAALAGFREYTTSVHVRKRSTLISMPTEVFLDWLYQDLPVYRSMVQFNLNMLSTQGRSSRSAVGQSSYQRILEFLNWYYAVVGKQQETIVKVQLTREQMVDEIGGISLRSLNRYLAQLSKEGLISLNKGKVQISQEQHAKIVEIIRS